MRAIMLLARLNEIDLAIDAEKARLTEIAEALREPAALIAARRGLAQAETDLAHCRAVQTELEAVQSDAGGKLAPPRRGCTVAACATPRNLRICSATWRNSGASSAKPMINSWTR